MKRILSDFSAIECNATVSRLSKTFNFLKAPFELAYFILDAKESTTLHNHVDNEVFLCLDGVARIQFDNEHYHSIASGEIVFVDKFKFHQITNDSDKPIIMLSISWQHK